MNLTIVITGANSGIGLATTQLLADMGNHIIALCRDNEMNRLIIKEVNDNCRVNKKGQVDFIPINLNNLHSIRQASHHIINLYPQVDVLICNAGVKTKGLYLTQQKFEPHFQVNYLGQFLLTQLLMPSLNNSKSARVIFIDDKAALNGNVDSLDKLITLAKPENKRDFHPKECYAESKLAQQLMCIKLAEQYPNVLFAGINPGTVNTNLNYRDIGLWRLPLLPIKLIEAKIGIIKSPQKAAEELLFLVTSPNYPSGKSWKNEEQVTPHSLSKNTAYLNDLYNQSMQWIGLK